MDIVTLALAKKYTDEQVASGGGHIKATDEKYFDIDDNGVVSLKPEYRGHPEKATEPYAVSDNGVGVDGSKIDELPEKIIIPDVINGTAVTAFQEAMFDSNERVRSITIPSLVTTIPKKFANYTHNLKEINGTENVEVIGQAAFQTSGIEKALFPNLKTLDGPAQFNNAGHLAIVDIGNSVTAIPTGCFSRCEKLSAIRGGASVTSIGDRAFRYTHNLRNLPFAGNLKSIDYDAFMYSRIIFDWWALKATLGSSAFGTNATPAQFNANVWWTDCTSTACERSLGSTFHQKNPEWADEYLPNSSDQYRSGCLETAAAHIYSALTGVKFDSPKYFVENIVGSIDNGRLLNPTGTESSGPAYSYDDITNWLNGVGLYSENLAGGWNNANLQKVYDALADDENPALVLTYIHSGHVGVIYGITPDGEVMLLESDPVQGELGVYEPTKVKIRIQNLTIAGSAVIITKKRSDNL